MNLNDKSRVILIQNPETDPGNQYRKQIETLFTTKNIPLETVVMDERNAAITHPGGSRPDLVISLGGDGTFLRAAQCFATDGIPLVGVNTGHLGFLTRIEVNRMDDYLDAIIQGNTTIESRLMLNVEKYNNLALNDIVLKNSSPSRLAAINVYLTDQFLAKYDADGLIVSTPTGSTAYNLSAGGPIMDPSSDVLAITPICPHSLSAKPIILPAATRLVLESDGANTSDLICAVDGDDAFTLEPGQRFTVALSPYQLPLVTFQDGADQFYSILKRKLGWGNNPRAINTNVAKS